MRWPRRWRQAASAEAPVPARGRRGGFWRGALSGLQPLGLLAALVAATLLLTALARHLLAPSGFFAEQLGAVIVLVAGSTLAVAVFAAASVRALRRVARWQQDGERIEAQAALWALAATALVVLAPLLLAILLPQHPVP